MIIQSGTALLIVLKNLAQSENAPESTTSSWAVIAGWLRVNDAELSSAQVDRFDRAWRAYLTIGAAPSSKLEAKFEEVSKEIRRRGLGAGRKYLPDDVKNVFDMWLTAEDQIAAKLRHERSRGRPRIFRTLNAKEKRPTSDISRKIMNRTTRILTVFSVGWLAWVSFRTSDDYQLFGIYLSDWDKDMFFLNALLPIVLAWGAVICFRWVNSAGK